MVERPVKKLPLKARDFSNLEKSFITPELATQAGLFRVDSASGALLVGRGSSADYSGIIFPYFWPGESTPRQSRLRRDHPEFEQKADGRVKEKGKYLSPPRSANLLYLMPGTPPEWLQDASLPVALVEGEKKTIALYRLSLINTTDPRPKFLPVGIPGVWNWRGKVGKHDDENGVQRDVKGAIPDFIRINWAGRIVYVFFDVNVATNNSVRAARDRLAEELIRRGAEVRFVDLPQMDGINGVDDLLASKGPDFVLGLIESAKLAQPKVPSGFRLSDDGVYTDDPKGQKDGTFISSFLTVSAATRNKNGEEWGRLLEFKDPDGLMHSWAMPMELLSGDGKEYRSRLLSMGLTIGTSRKSRELLTRYIQSSYPDERVRCVHRVGWHNGAFVLPGETFGPEGSERTIFQGAPDLDHRFRAAGTLDDWRENIGRCCSGNSRLAFAVSCAFAGPLLPLTGEGGGGFHYRGASSIGKTTAQLVAGSVWGGDQSKGYLQSWRATINGLESVAELHNHGLLCLDELAQCDPREVGDVAYMLANGMGKVRMSRGLGSGRRFEWDLVFLSSGETGLSDLIESTGKHLRGGQSVRMCDLEVDAGAGLGGFENLHGFSSPAALARHLGEMSKRFYGTPIRAFLSELINYQEEIVAAARNLRAAFLREHVPAGSSSEVYRVASRFALVASAGESTREITGWQAGEAITAAKIMFKVWIEGRGTKGGCDTENAVRQVKAFIEAHGGSRFQSVQDDLAKINNRVGFRRATEEGNTEYLILPGAFRKEICSGYDARMVARTLAERGYLLRGDGNNLTRRESVPEFGRTRVYLLLPTLLSAEDV